MTKSRRTTFCTYTTFNDTTIIFSIVLKEMFKVISSLFLERYGRIVIYLISCFGVGVAGVVVAFAPNFPVFVVFRFLQGVFGKGTWMTAYVIGKTSLHLLVCLRTGVWG